MAHASPYFRNVKDFGAKGDGHTDDTKAIQAALTEGRSPRSCQSCGMVNQTGIVYIPSGTYMVKGELHLYYDTFIHGNPCARPKLKLISGNSYVLSGPYSGDNLQHTNDFYYGVADVDIDVTDGGGSATAIHWPVSQGTYLRNMRLDVGSNMRGIFGESGSGGLIADVEIYGGRWGIDFGNQQWTFRNLKVSGAREACVHGIWQWSWVFVGLDAADCPVGINWDPSQPTGSLLVLDSTFKNVDIAISAKEANIQILVDRVELKSVGSLTNGTSGGTRTVHSWRQGPALARGEAVSGNRGDLTVTRTAALVQRARPRFGDAAVFNARDAGAKGDGHTDDTAALQRALDEHDEVFLPHGTYIISKTLRLRGSTSFFGEGYTTLMAKAGVALWADANSPAPMLEVPQDKSARTRLADFALDSAGDNPGCVMVDWGAGRDSGAWDIVFRLQHTAHTLWKIHRDGGGYFENVWLWVADHDIYTGHMIKVSNQHGLVVEGNTEPIWWYASASEHSLADQYLFDNAQDVIMVMGQTESAYWPDPPTSPGLRIRNSKRFWLYGSAMEAWFINSQRPPDGTPIQDTLIEITDSEDIYLYGPGTHNARNIMTGDHTLAAQAPYDQNNGIMFGFIANVPW